MSSFYRPFLPVIAAFSLLFLAGCATDADVESARISAEKAAIAAEKAAAEAKAASEKADRIFKKSLRK
jgi:hypothetical protein